MKMEAALKNITKVVKHILETEPQTRNSDSYLYFKVLKRRADQIGVDLRTLPVASFLLEMNEYGFPIFESVRRSRQKIQAAHPELAACEAVEEFRMENEKVFRGYALEHLEGGQYGN